MSKLYVVQGATDYEGFDVLYISESREKAEDYLDRAREQKYYDDVDIEEYETDISYFHKVPTPPEEPSEGKP